MFTQEEINILLDVIIYLTKLNTIDIKPISSRFILQHKINVLMFDDIYNTLFNAHK